MDAMDILGSLLRRKAESSSRGGAILKDMMSGTPRQPAPSRSPTRHGGRRPVDISDAADNLEDLLNVSTEHHEQRRKPRSLPPTVSDPEPPRRESTRSPARDYQATVLVRAMIGAAKADGQIGEAEQREILKQFPAGSREELEFLRQEFSQAADARELAWNVPLGMEEQVYQISVIAIDLDEQKEAEYLADLAQGLRLDPKECNRMHRKLGAPVIFQE